MIPSILFWGITLGVSIRQMLAIGGIDLVEGEVLPGGGGPAALPGAIAAGLGLSGFAAWSIRRFAGRPEPEETRAFNFALLPLLPAAAAAAFPFHLISPVLFSLAVGWAAGRVFALLRLPRRPLPMLPALMLLTAAALLWAWYGTTRQKQSLNLMLMQWHDWGHYYEALRNTLTGNFFYLNEGHGCFLGIRFCAGLVVLLPYLLLFDSPEAFFLLGSLILAAGAPVIFLLCRALRFSVPESLAFGMTYLAIPGIVNLNMSLVDGFHENYLLIPVSLAAILCYERKKLPAAMLLVLFSLTIRETVFVMWLGYAAVLVCRGERRRGLLFGAAVAALAALIIGGIMPLCRSGAGGYEHFRYFQHLGENGWAIMLSPLRRPEAFFGSIFQARNFYFALLLLFPFVFLGGRVPLLLLPLLGDFLLVAADARIDSQNITRHYQVVMQIVVITAAVYGYAKVRTGRGNRLTRSFTAGLAPRNRGGLLAGAAVTAFAGCFFFAQLPWSKAEDLRMRRYGDAQKTIAEFKALIPPGAAVTASTRVAAQLVGRNDIHHDLDPAARPGLRDYVFFEPLDEMYGGLELRDHLLKNPAYAPVKTAYLDGRLLMLFTRTPGASPPAPPILRFDDPGWANAGVPIPCDDANFAAAIRWRRLDHGGLARIMLRVLKPVDYEVAIRAELALPDGKGRVYFLSFGNGLYPAYFARPGEACYFEVMLPAPPEGAAISLRPLRFPAKK